MSTQGTTLHRHLWQQQRQYSNISPKLSALLMQLAFATKILASEISRAALVGHLGLVGEKNATGGFGSIIGRNSFQRRKPDAPRQRLQVRPFLPEWLPDLELTNLAVGDAKVDLRFWGEDEQTRWEITHLSGE